MLKITRCPSWRVHELSLAPWTNDKFLSRPRTGGTSAAQPDPQPTKKENCGTAREKGVMKRYEQTRCVRGVRTKRNFFGSFKKYIAANVIAWPMPKAVVLNILITEHLKWHLIQSLKRIDLSIPVVIPVKLNKYFFYKAQMVNSNRV